MILAIDIGGTKTLVALFARKAERWVMVKQKKYRSAECSSISAILADFTDQHTYMQVHCICAGVAGPVVNQACQITNLSWSLSVAEISKATGVKKVYLLNDLEATAWGVRYLRNDKLLNINSSAEVRRGNTAILSAGTGLGEAMIIEHDNFFTAVATEGGHTDFAPQNEEQDGLLVFLREKYQGHVSYERLVSGEGLHNIYQYLKSIGDSPPDKAIEEKICRSDPAAIIGHAGLTETDILCKSTVRIFCQIYAAEAANLALKCLPYAGVVLAGGMTPKLLPAIKRQYFMNAFLKKGRYQKLLQKIPVRVCMDEQIVLSGALASARYYSELG